MPAHLIPFNFPTNTETFTFVLAENSTVAWPGHQGLLMATASTRIDTTLTKDESLLTQNGYLNKRWKHLDRHFMGMCAQLCQNLIFKKPRYSPDIHLGFFDF